MIDIILGTVYALGIAVSLPVMGVAALGGALNLAWSEDYAPHGDKTVLWLPLIIIFVMLGADAAFGYGLSVVL